MIYLFICAIYEAENADIARTLGFDLMTISIKSMQQTTSLLSEGDSSVCN